MGGRVLAGVQRPGIHPSFASADALGLVSAPESDPGAPQGSRALGDGCGGQAVESQPGRDGLWHHSVLGTGTGQSSERLTQGALGWPSTDEETDSEGKCQRELGLIRTHLLTPSLPEQGLTHWELPERQARPEGHVEHPGQGASRGMGRGAEHGEAEQQGRGLRS